MGQAESPKSATDNFAGLDQSLSSFALIETEDSSAGLIWNSVCMAQTISVIIGSWDRTRLSAILGDQNRPLKHVQRASIVLLSAERLAVMGVARRAGVSRPAVWRW